MAFNTEQLNYMHDIFIDPDGFPPLDHDLVVSIETEIDAQLNP